MVAIQPSGRISIFPRRGNVGPFSIVYAYYDAQQLIRDGEMCTVISIEKIKVQMLMRLKAETHYINDSINIGF